MARCGVGVTKETVRKKETEVSGIQLVDVDVCELQGGGGDELRF